MHSAMGFEMRQMKFAVRPWMPRGTFVAGKLPADIFLVFSHPMTFPFLLLPPVLVWEMPLFFDD
jgi:hypothetical protein